MFTPFVRRVELSSLEEVKNFSEQQYNRRSEERKVFYQNNGQIAFVDEIGNYFVTPYRTEIHSILRSCGYKEYSIFVPNSNGEVPSARYAWLRQLAERENWAVTHEEAYAYSQKKGIREVSIKCNPKHYQFKEIDDYGINDGKWIYHPMIMMYLCNSSKESIGTYIQVDDNIILACDEYGRTFKITAHTQHAYNSIVNAMIEAGYKPNHTPEAFVSKYVEPDITEEGDDENEERDLIQFLHLIIEIRGAKSEADADGNTESAKEI